MKVIRSILLASLLALLAQSASSQCANEWKAVGPNDFNQVNGLGQYGSYYTVSAAGIPYAAFSDPAFGGFASVMRFVNDKWEYVGDRGFSTIPVESIIIKIDANSVPYVSFMHYNLDDSLTVMKFDGNKWQVVGQPNIVFSWGGGILETDHNNSPFVAASGKIFSLNNGAWTLFSTVSAQANSIQKLVFDKSNVPYIIFSDGQSGYSVGRFDGAAWQDVGASGFIPATAYGNMDLAIDELNRPILSYSSNGFMTTQVYNGSSWLSVGSPISGADPNSSGAGLAIDKLQNQPVVSFKSSAGPVKVYKFDGNVWNAFDDNYFSYNWNGGGPPGGLQIANGITYVACGYLVQHDGNWQVIGDTGINFPDYYGSSSALMIDKKNIPYVVYNGASVTNCGGVAVKQFKDNAWIGVGNWNTSATPINGEVAIASDTNAVPHVLYSNSICFSVPTPPYYYCDFHLYALRFNGSTWDPLGPPLNISSGNASLRSIALKFDKDNTLYRAFIDGTANNQVRVQKFNNNTWIDVNSPVAGSSGSFNLSFELSPDGVPYIAFVTGNSAGGTLHVLSLNGGSWSNIGVLPSNLTALVNPSLAFSSSGVLYCSFSDTTGPYTYSSSVLKFDGSQWSDVGPRNFTGTTSGTSALKISKHDEPYLLYSTEQNAYNIRLKKFDGTTWSQVGTDTVAASVAYPKNLVFDTSDVPYIGYGGSLFVKKLACETISSSTKGAGYCSNLLIYPNFSSGTFSLNPLINTNRVEVYSMMGEMIYESAQQKAIDRIDLNARANGVYIVRIEDGKGNSCITKIIKNSP